jgi:hypothetical protein
MLLDVWLNCPPFCGIHFCSFEYVGGIHLHLTSILECLLAWHILFIAAENWNAKYITTLHQAYSNMLLGFEIFIQ